MISFFSVMIYVTSIIAIVVTLVFYAGILMSNKNISSGQVYTSCSAQLKTCKVSSVVFVLVYWFCVSGLSKKECLKGYAALSKVCSRSNDNNGKIKIFLFFDGNNFPGIFSCFKGGLING